MLATSKSGSTTWKAVAEAFGATGSLPESSITMNLRFPGQYFDSETGVHYNFQRDFNVSSGRYIQSDSIGLKGGVNLFGYVNGNPLLLIDSTGEIIWIPIIINGVIAAGAEAITTGVTKGWRCVDVGDMLLAGAAGAAFSGAVAGLVKISIKKGGYKILGTTVLGKGTPKGDYINHTIFKSGPNPNWRIEWATHVVKRKSSYGFPHFHTPTNAHLHPLIPPLSGGPIGFIMAKEAEPCECN